MSYDKFEIAKDLESFFAIWMGKIQSKLHYRLVTYEVASS